jgi:hypothetical protein
LRILNANLVNLNPNASKEVANKKISLSNNVLKIIRKKSKSPELDSMKTKTSPPRGLLVLKNFRKSPPPPDNRPVLANDFIKQMINSKAPEGKLKIRRSPPR